MNCLRVKIRSKEPENETSVLSEFAVKESKEKFSSASQDFKFAAAVAAFGMALRDSPTKGAHPWKAPWIGRKRAKESTNTATAKNSSGWSTAPFPFPTNS